MDNKEKYQSIFVKSLALNENKFKGHPHISKTFASYSLATKYAQESELKINMAIK